jgi:hypothetical protein
VEKQSNQTYSNRNELFRCYPNPFKNQTTIGYSITVDCNVAIGVFDILGNQVRVLVRQTLPAGYHESVFNAGNISPGIYYCKMAATSVSGHSIYSKVIRMEVMK